MLKQMYLKNDQLLACQFSESRQVEKHQHRNAELLYLLKGSLSVKIDDEEFQVQENDVVVINPMHQHSFSATAEVFYASFHLNYHILLSLLHAGRIFFMCNSSIEDKAEYDTLRKLLKRIMNIHYEQTGHNEIQLNIANYQMLDYLLQKFSVTYSHSVKTTRKDEDRRNEIEDFIQNNYHRLISLKEIADYFYLSPPYLSKVFKEQFGMNFYKYLNNVRLLHAVNELLGSDQSITSIAMNNGFPNVSSFIKGFKEEFQTTPNDYRMKQIRNTRNEAAMGSVNWRAQLERVLNAPAAEQLNQGDFKAAAVLDVTETARKPFVKYWTKVINLNEASMLMNFSFQDQITNLKEELGFEYGRIWRIFAKEMKLLEGARKERLNFFNLERIFDFMMEKRIKPYLVLNPAEDLVHLKLNSGEGSSSLIDAFTARFLSFMSNMINRYGLKQVQDWYIEIVFIPGNGQIDEAVYFQLFSRVKEMLLMLSPHFKVGGAGLPVHYNAEKFRFFIGQWFSSASRPDFLTLHSDLHTEDGVQGEHAIRRLMDARYLQNQVLIVKKIITDAGYELDDIQISSWDFSSSQHNMLNDSCYKAAYLVKNIIDCYGLLQAMGYSYALDSLSSLADTPLLLYGGPGLLSRQGLKKPSYYAYAFLNIGESKFFLGKDSQSLITAADGTDNYFIVCHNCGTLNYKYYMEQSTPDDPTVYADLFEEEGPRILKYRITDIKNGTYKVKIRSVNERNGNVQQEWIKLNMGNDLRNSEIEYLRKISVPRMKIMEIEVKSGVLELETILDRNEIQSIRITYQY